MKIVVSIFLWFSAVGIVRSEDFASSSACKVSYDDQTVPDCNCRVESVDHAVKYFISPLLSNLVTKYVLFTCAFYVSYCL